jgi:membrane protein
MTFIEWWNDNTFRFAASLAFYTIFSLAPVLLIATGVASLFLARDVANRRVLAEIQKLIGDQGVEGLRQVLRSSEGFGDSTLAIIVGVATFALGATAVFAELQAALNTIWDVQADPDRGFLLRLIAQRLRSFAIALGVGFLLLVSLIISAALSGLQSWLSEWGPGVPWVWQAANIVASMFVITLLFAMIYRYLPDVEIAWGDVWIGAAVTAALFTAGKYVIGVYLGQTAVASAFGAAGSFAVLLIWVYYSALISFLGAEFTQVYARRHGTGIRPLKHAERVGRNPDRPRA